MNFGEVWESHQHQVIVEFHNRGSSSIRIERFDTSCDCIRVSTDQLVIPPDEKRTVVVTVDLFRNKPGDLSTASWPVKYPMGVIWNNGGSTQYKSEWILTGSANSIATIEPSSLFFGSSVVSGGKDECRSAIVHPRGSLSDISVFSVPNGFEYKWERLASEYKLTVWPNDQLLPGTFAKEIKLQVNDLQHRPMLHKVLSVSGVKLDKAFSLPTSLQYGLVGSGDEVERTIAIKSSSHEAVRSIQAATLAGMTIVNKSKAENGWEIRLRHKITDLGPQSGILKIQAEMSSGQNVAIAIPISWHAIETPYKK